MWMKDKTVITMNAMMISYKERASVEYSGTGSILTLKDVKLEDGGEYLCQVLSFTHIELTHTVTILGMTTSRFKLKTLTFYFYQKSCQYQGPKCQGLPNISAEAPIWIEIMQEI